ncbi:MAG: hypothetical protein HN979_00700 [Actinobacteria bacterium]|nr:hypothetical protein [Actinomycetota bacterium]MBT3686556.1 hypothetical protein [Actinomycetota bacterium]MBT4038356.1 hypothetical protein [Actinomycetota bacterium]MBT4279450.1 hypothetical protein [Actinomycetota bacterium]MBT4343592.1 hypothetical protein [Actinomycetota bacterium]
MERGTRFRRGPDLIRCTVALLVAVVVATACGASEPAGIDVEAVEHAVPLALLPSHPELVGDVACPLLASPGLGPVPCTATISGLSVPLIVSRPDTDGRVHVESPVELVMAGEVASEAEERLDSDLGVDNAVVCEPALRVSRAGQEFACTATEPNGRTHSLTAVLVDAAGSFRLNPG